MVESFTNIVVKIFNNNVVLATIVISMLPIIELRGAIPFATNKLIWNSFALSKWQALSWSLIGSSIVVPILALVFTPIINWLKRTKLFNKIAKALESRIQTKAMSISNNNTGKSKNNYWKKLLGVFIFVAIPLPLTGVWTGTCVAVLLGLDYWSICSTVICGNIVAGILIVTILQFMPWLNDYLFFIFLGIVAIILTFELIKHLFKQRKNNDKQS